MTDNKKFFEEQNNKKYHSYDWYNTLDGRLKTLLASAQRRAKKKNIKYSLDIDWLMGKYKKQNGKCLLSNIKLEIIPGEGINPFSPSLDRRDPLQGYTKKNTRLVCAAINIALSDFGEEVLKIIAEGFLSRQEKRANINTAKRTQKSREKASKSTAGESNPRAKVTEHLVKEIRILWETEQYTQVALSEKFNIPKPTINHIIKRYTWKHI
jgi:predicted XRE-type DNA-binding protein